MSDLVVGKPIAAAEIPHKSLRLFRAGGLPRPVFRQAAADKLDYCVDFAPLLEDGESAVSASATIEADTPALVIERVDFAGARVLVWCIGGANRQRYSILVQIGTTAGETKQARFDVVISATADLVEIGITTSGVDVPERGAPTVLTTDKAFLMFTGVAVNGTSAPQSVVLTNGGVAALDIDTIEAGTYYEVTHNCPASLAPGGFCTINVSAKPKVSGRQGGSLAISGDENKTVPLITDTA